MKLYEINEEILRLTDQIVFDEETGEILCDMEALTAQIENLQMERRSILEYLAKLVLNLRADSAALKAEEARMHSRRLRIDKKVERLLQILDRECGGEKTDLGIATLMYRRSAHVEVSDEAKAISWLKSRNMTNCFRVPSPELAKSEVRKLLSVGTEIPGCALVEERSYSLK